MNAAPKTDDIGTAADADPCMVTTASGSGRLDSSDGVGTRAYLAKPVSITLSGVDGGDSLLVGEIAGAHRIRRVWLSGGTERVRRLIVAALDTSGIDGIPPLIALITSYAARDGETESIAGNMCGFSHGKALTAAAFTNPEAICVDPLNPASAYFIGDQSSVRYCDSDGDVSLVAGHVHPGYADGVGGRARFNNASGVISTRDGRRLYVADRLNNCVRRIELPVPENRHSSQSQSQSSPSPPSPSPSPCVGDVKTVAGAGQNGIRDGPGPEAFLSWPRKLVFDRSSKHPPESVLWIATYRTVARYDLATNVVTTPFFSHLKHGRGGFGSGGTGINPPSTDPKSKQIPVPAPVVQSSLPPALAAEPAWAIESLDSGLLLVVMSCAVAVFNPDNFSASYVLAGEPSDPYFGDGTGGENGEARFKGMRDLVVVGRERAAYVCDMENNRIRRMALPARLFPVSTVTGTGTGSSSTSVKA